MEFAERMQLLDVAYDSAMRLHTLYNKVYKLSAMWAGQWQFALEPVEHCTGQKIRIADIVDKYDVLAPAAHSRIASRLRTVPLA
jgi:hypothetical protein